jgi:hypothetical protein
MNRIPRFAVIPSNGRECLLGAMESIKDQVDWVLVIWTNPRQEHPWETPPFQNLKIIYHIDCLQEINISRWFNTGLNYIEGYIVDALGKWDVAILNDDAIVPEGWFDAVAGKMREMRAAAACSGGVATSMPVLHTQPGPVNIHTRMYGPAFIVAGELGLRANEELKWWFTDDWMDWESRKLGGMVMIPGFQVQHLHPNGQMTGELQEQISRDANKFKEIYGVMPI